MRYCLALVFLSTASSVFVAALTTGFHIFITNGNVVRIISINECDDLS